MIDSDSILDISYSEFTISPRFRVHARPSLVFVNFFVPTSEDADSSTVIQYCSDIANNQPRSGHEIRRRSTDRDYGSYDAVDISIGDRTASHLQILSSHTPTIAYPNGTNHRKPSGESRPCSMIDTGRTSVVHCVLLNVRVLLRLSLLANL